MNIPKKNARTAADNRDLCTQRIGALRKYVQPNTEITINTKVYKLEDLIAVFQHDSDAITQVSTTRSRLKMDIAAMHDADATRKATDAGLKGWVGNQFGADSQAAHDFGFPPTKKAHRTTATSYVASVKNKATRAARNTMGKKQKAEIKGTPVGPVIVPMPPAPVPVVVNGAPHAAPAGTPAPSGTPVPNGAPVPHAANGATATS